MPDLKSQQEGRGWNFPPHFGCPTSSPPHGSQHQSNLYQTRAPDCKPQQSPRKSTAPFLPSHHSLRNDTNPRLPSKLAPPEGHISKQPQDQRANARKEERAVPSGLERRRRRPERGEEAPAGDPRRPGRRRRRRRERHRAAEQAVAHWWRAPLGAWFIARAPGGWRPSAASGVRIGDGNEAPVGETDGRAGGQARGSMRALVSAHK